jgi:hypothetical protein
LFIGPRRSLARNELVLYPKIIDKNLSEVNGENLWTEEFMIQNAAILPWEFLCSNPYISWTEELIDQLSPFWKKAEQNPKNQNPYRKMDQDRMHSPQEG